MPAKNLVKPYVPDGCYHIYNRGVEKRLVFQDNEDYAVFLNCLKNYLSPKCDMELRHDLSVHSISSKDRERIWHLLRLKNYSETITLLAYCLMPNHFHLLVRQRAEKSIASFMSSLSTRYTLYFNRKYERTGLLFQGTYKAVLVDSDSQFLELTRYIHKQALSLQGYTLQGDQPSSYPEYIGERKTAWVHPEEILVQYSNINPATSYATFVSDSSEKEMDYLGNLALDMQSMQGDALHGEGRRF
jgi:putative transposase